MIVITVSSRGTMAGLDVTLYTVCYLAEPGLEGFWIWTLGDFSAQIAIDTDNGVYLKATSTSASVGAWVRKVDDNIWHTDWFSVPRGASGCDPDASAALIRMFDLFNLSASTASGVRYGNAIYNLDAPLPIPTKPMAHLGTRDPQGTILNKRYSEVSLNGGFDGGSDGACDVCAWDGSAAVDSGGPRGVLAFSDWGGYVADLNIQASAGAGGSGLSSILTQNATAVGRLVIDRVRISGDIYFDYSVYIDGSSNTSATPGNQGIMFRECEIFGARLAAFYANCVRHLYGAPLFVASTTCSQLGSTKALVIDGTTSTSDDVQIKGVVSLETTLANLTRSVINSPICSSVNVASTVSSTVVQGAYDYLGILQHTWAGGSFYDVGRSYLDRADVYMTSTYTTPTKLTGAGAVVQVQFDTVAAALDLGAPSAYSTSNGQYTATRAGYHSVKLQVCVVYLTSAHNRLNLGIQQYAADHTEIMSGRRTNAVNPSAILYLDTSANAYATIVLNAEIYMNPGDYLLASIWVTGGPQQVAIFGTLSTLDPHQYSRMDARLS